jgi:predicted lysophospholipase L1 biosynthesis ABC-type transport system permease subunit
VTIGGRPREVVGVVRDAQVYGIGQVQPIYFAPFVPDGNLVRGPAALLLPSQMAAPAVRILREMDARIATEAIPLTAQLNRSLGDTVGVARMAGALGLMALLLATVGVYGVISYSVEQRRREIGVRMALGARPGQVVRLVLRRNARAVAIGLAVGLAIAAGLTVVLKSELYGLSPVDPLAYAGVLTLLLLAGLAASVIPARRAARTDALLTLHHE